MMHAERRPPSWQPRRWYACIFIVCLVIIGVAGVSLLSSYETALHEEKSNLLHALSASAAETNKIILATSLAVERTEQLILAPGRQGEITADPDAGTDIRNALIQEVAALPGVISMSVLDRHGKWSISSRFSKLPLSPDNPERPIWNAALQTKPGGFFLLDSSKSPVFDIPSLVLGRPVRDSSGALTGIVVAFVAVDSIRQAFSSLLLDGHQVMVSLPNGKDLVRIPQEHPHILDGMDSGLAKMMAAGEGILDADDGFGHPWIVAMHHSEFFGGKPAPFPAHLFMSPESLVDTALVALDQGEAICFPTLGSTTAWLDFDQSRANLVKALTLSGVPAARYQGADAGQPA